MYFVSISPDLLTFAIFRLFQAQKSSFQDTNGLLAGIKGYVTNLDIPDDQVITYYHQLFQFEATFWMAKSDMRARPIYHQNREAIEAHLTIVLTALAISRNIERKTGISIKQFIKLLRPIRSGIVTFNGKELLAEAEVPETTLVVLDRLPSGH
jgi:transposase